MNTKHLALSVLLGVAVAIVPAFGGCNDNADSTNPPPTGPFAAALAGVGGGGAGSLGVGWADPQLVEESGLTSQVIASALGPNAASVIEEAPRLSRRFGLEPLAAERLISVGGSYAFGLRLDGVDGHGLARALVADGGRTRQVGGLELVEIGDYAVVPEELLSLGVRGLGAFDALGRELTVLAISDRARAALPGRGDRLIDEPVYRAAADCLDDVVAARMIPDKLLLSSEVGIDQVAMGVKAGAEVLCVLGGTAERADEVASAKKTSLGPGARDPVTREPIGDSSTGVEVTKGRFDGV